MEIRQREEGSTTILEPSGRLVGKTLPLLEERIHDLLEKARTRFVIDLTDVERIDSLGLRLLLTVARRLGPSDGALVLCSMNREVQEIFDTVGLAGVFSIASSQDEAIRFLRQGKGSAREISRLAAEILGVADHVERSDRIDDPSVQRLSTLAISLLVPPEEKPVSGEGPCATERVPSPAEDPTPGQGLFSKLWSKISRE